MPFQVPSISVIMRAGWYIILDTPGVASRLGLPFPSPSL